MGKLKWTYNRCLIESKKYISYSMFNSNSYIAYRKSIEKGWINDFIWLKDDRGFYDEVTKMYTVYKYEWNDTNTVYIGLTKNLKERDRDHRKEFVRGNKNKSAVKRYSILNGVPIPNPIILNDILNANEARILEDYWVKYYKNKNYNVLNKGKTGLISGSLGGPLKKWTEKKCKDEASKYNSITDFQKGAYGAYRVAKNSGWLESYSWMKRKIHENGYWTKERCIEESKKYVYKRDFFIGSRGAYAAAKRFGIIDDFTWLKLRREKNINCYDRY